MQESNSRKNGARGKCLTRKTRINLDNYQQKRIKANTICRRKKKEWIQRRIKEINETNRKRDTRKFYKDVRNLSNLPTATTLVCRDKDGNILSDKKKILERWKNYFKQLLNPEAKRIISIKAHEDPINNLELEERTYEEINEIIKKTSNPTKLQVLMKCYRNL